LLFSFAEFILQDYNFSGSNKWIPGCFLHILQRGERGNPPDFGLRDLRLIQ
jgi:hypothetical protein